LISCLSPEQKALKLYDWSFWARDEQLVPPPREDRFNDWIYWLYLAGRGAGKTRTGAETVRQWIKDGFTYVNLIGATAEDVRSIMIDGDSGIMAACPPNERPRYLANQRTLKWPNGAVSLIFSAEEPDRLRGKQHMKLWCDEVAAWRYGQAAWDDAMFGLRLGRKPQVVVTTTPRLTKLIKELRADPRTHLTTGSTYDNVDNLAPDFVKRIVSKYKGTRLGRQEIYAQILDDNPGALFKSKDIDETRCAIGALPALRRIVVAIDPAVSSTENSDETGVVVAGIDANDHVYILLDASGIMKPNEWAKAAVDAYHAWKADRIIGEINRGGDMVEATIRG
jgi:phage terminase large subunit-like protein